ncbi:MAG: radical SAM protein, partial [Bacteroides sp.]|nr:radical SAM protein [Bacteroides sp.]
MTMPQLTDWLPTTRREMELHGWNTVDVVIFSADAYVDHPSFGAAVIGRIIEAEGFRVCIVPQPDWHGDFRDFRRFGRPRLCFMVAPGGMDSMVNKYTAARRLRSEDAFSPDGRHDMRPEMPTIVYTRILKSLYPDCPVVLGGIEASLRRVSHYDYWKQQLRPSILEESGADLITYGMGELPTIELVHLLENRLGHHRDECVVNVKDFHELLRKYPIRQTVALMKREDIPGGITPDDIVLASHETCLADRKAHAKNFRHIEEESNSMEPKRLIQPLERHYTTDAQMRCIPCETQGVSERNESDKGIRYVIVNPMFPSMTQEQIDHSFDLPYTRLPHPKYKGKTIPAYEMIKFSVNLHRGCFGGCAFCTISAHQGKFIMSRSKESILREVKEIIKMPDFKGYLSDLGGPSANMYAMRGKNQDICRKCRKPSCIHPTVCPNLNADHGPLLDIYRAVDALPGIKKSFIGSGVRYDLLLHPYKDETLRKHAEEYTRQLILNHVSGRLKVAPEHTSAKVLSIMRKPDFSQFHNFKRIFDDINRRAGLKQQIIPYFMSSHPGCHAEDMAELAAETKDLDFRLEQVQDFTPTPMTVATTCWYSGFHPYTLEPIFTAVSDSEKLRQRMFFFW